MAGIINITVILVFASITGCGGSSSSSVAATDVQNVPVAQDVAISGDAEISEVLTGMYTWYDADGDAEGTSLYQWLISDTVDGEYTEIPGAIALQYTVAAADLGKYLRFRVTPVAVSDSSQEGESVLSDPIGPVTEKQEPYATDVRITGNLQDTKVLTGNYTYNDQQDDLESGTTFRWLISSTADGTFSPIIGAESQTYTVQSGDVGRYIRFEVTVRAATGTDTVGEPSTSIVNGPIVAADAPYATNVSITGTPAVGATFTGNYTFKDDQLDAEAVSTFRWYRSTTTSGPFEVISGQTTKTYVLQEADRGRYITFEVTPVAATGTTLVGAPVMSVAQGPIKGYAKITVDGEIDEPDWTAADMLYFTDNQLVEDGGADNDISHVYTAWDVDYLYIAIRGNFGNGDGSNTLVLYIDTLYDGGNTSKALSFTGIAAANTDGTAADPKFGYEYVLVCSTGHTNGSDHGLYARNNTTEITDGVTIVEDGVNTDAVEVRISWTSLGITDTSSIGKLAFIPIVTTGDGNSDGIADDWFDDTGLAAASPVFTVAVTDGTGLKKVWQ